MQKRSELRHASSKPADRRLLRMSQIALVALSTGLVLVGRQISLWPIMTWPVYSHYSKGFPETTEDDVSLWVVSSTQEIYKYKPSDLFVAGRKRIPGKIIETAFDHTVSAGERDASRIYLSHLIRYLEPNIQIAQIQGYRTYWKVEPLALPPLDYEAPADVVLLGSFYPTDYLEAKSEQP